jgi:SAM-dependent methyltransferase
MKAAQRAVGYGSGETTGSAATAGGRNTWQLQMFNRSLKKRLKLQSLLGFLGDVSGQECLLVTCGDNNGALNWHFREHGGAWTWADVVPATEDVESRASTYREMEQLLGEPVYRSTPERLPFADGRYDCVVSIDTLEHLGDDQQFLGEVDRVLRPGGRAIVTVPNGDPRLLANRMKWRVGMTPEVYGHTRAGYTVDELRDAMARAGFAPVSHGGYSRFFTEIMELAVNFGFVFVLSKKNGGAAGRIAPSSSKELKTHGLAYRLYSLAFPVMRLVSKLDRTLPASSDNAVVVSAIKPSAEVIHG